MVEGFHLCAAQTRAGVLLGRGELPVLDLLGRALQRLPLRLAVVVDERVGEDAVEPRLEREAFLELMERGERLDEGFLDKVFRVCRVARHPQRSEVQLVEERHRVAFEPRSTLLAGLLDRTHRFQRSLRPVTGLTATCCAGQYPRGATSTGRADRAVSGPSF